MVRKFLSGVEPGARFANTWDVLWQGIHSLSERFQCSDICFSSFDLGSIPVFLEDVDIACLVKYIVLLMSNGSGLRIGWLALKRGIAGCNNGVADGGIELEYVE